MPAGKPQAFSEKENLVMRKILRDLKERSGWSQDATGKMLGIGQQAAGRILNKNGGFSRPTALKLAEMCGYESPEAMLSDIGQLSQAKDAPQGWRERDLAAGTARRLGYDGVAIERIVGRFTESRYTSMPAKWWMDRIVAESAALAAERDVPSSRKSEPAPRSRSGRTRGVRAG